MFRFWGQCLLRKQQMNPFSRMHRLSLFICARTYSAGLFTSPPTGAVCQRRLWMQKTMGWGVARKLFIMKTERQEWLGVAPPSVPSILETNVKIAGAVAWKIAWSGRKRFGSARSEASEPTRRFALAGCPHRSAARPHHRGKPIRSEDNSIRP